MTLAERLPEAPDPADPDALYTAFAAWAAEQQGLEL
jgi:hypothetical protein